jgi:hypothetical protein
MSGERFLSRWVRRKAEAKIAAQAAQPLDAPPTAEQAAQPAAPLSDPSAASPPTDASAASPPLPPVESLTFDSDFTPFLRPGVDADLKREAIKSLLRDPRFNVMDGLDVYIDDYSKPDPLPEGWLEKMTSVSWLGDQPARERAAEEARVAEAEAAANAEKPEVEQPAAALPETPASDPSGVEAQPATFAQSPEKPKNSS